MQTIPAIVAVLPFLGVLIGAALQYFFGRTLEIEKQLTLRKGEAYADYYRAVALLATKDRSGDNVSLAAEAKTRICIYGSVAVVRRLAGFEHAGAKASTPGRQGGPHPAPQRHAARFAFVQRRR
jgi:hypothetical protein